MDELLILVNEKDEQVGVMDKTSVHQSGLLHRAFSVFIFNSKGELLLQQRADEKYHSGGLWSNACCSHPRNGEDLYNAVIRRLYEEMGLRCEPGFVFNFIYKANFENGLMEHEFDHVFFGVSDTIPVPDKTEVKAWKYISLQELKNELLIHPKEYSAWLKICFEKVAAYVEDDEQNKKISA